MLYCPYCGTKVKDDEHFCVNCGKSLPNDINARFENKKKLNKWWFLPLVTILLIAITVGVYAYLLQHHTSTALELYTEAAQHLTDENYTDANRLLEEALDHRTNFTQAQIALHFTEEAIMMEEQLTQAEQLVKNNEFKPAIDMINKAEDRINTYTGPAVSLFVERLDAASELVKLEQLKWQMEQDPSFNDLKILIWEADDINLPEANEIAVNIRDQIIDYAFSIASKELNEKQFNDALLIAEDGLKYAPESEKLLSLVTNINKEKLAFETEVQQRMEQAMNTAHEEHEINENDAINVVSVNIENDENNQVVIKGEVKSVATVPINSVLVEYALVKDDNELLSNEVFVYPDILYPDEKGKFEYTHFDLNAKSTEIKVEVRKITWYTK